MDNNKFLVGCILREVKNARLNCNNPKNEQYKMNTENATYVKKIRRGNETFPYASVQWQKKNIKEFAGNQGFNISLVTALSTKEAVSEGHPVKNYDEDVMGFMIAKNLEITEEDYKNLDKEEKKEFKKDKNKDKEVIYKKNITKKRRANLMMTPLQAIGNTRIIQEFCTRQTDKTPLLYTKEVYSTNMSSGFILDIDKVGKFKVSNNEADYREYDPKEIDLFELKPDDNNIVTTDKKEKKKRIIGTLKGLQYMTNKTTMANNLEDLSAKFIIMAEYSIGNAVFNNIFEDNKLKVNYLKEAIEENEDYRISKIYIGVRNEFFKQEDEYLLDIVKREFGLDDRFEVGTVNEVIDKYIENLEV